MSASGYMADPPPGVERMPDNPPTLAPNMYASGITTTIIAFIMVVVRIHTRWHLLGRRIKADDYLVMAAMVFSFILLIMASKEVDAGVGRHMWDVPFEVYAWLPLYGIFATNSYSISICLSKLSILTFYLQLSPCQWFRTLVWVLVTSVIIYTVTYVFATIFTCTPVAAAWDLTLIPTAKCLPVLTRYMVLSILNICIDVCTLVLPLTVVLPLQMTIRRKISLIFLFTTGLFVCIIAIRRTIILPPLLRSADYTWDAVEQFHWCFMEVNVGIVCASVPALKAFVSRYMPKLAGSWNSAPDAHSGASGSNRQKASGNVSTVVERNMDRRRAKGQSYELRSKTDKQLDAIVDDDDEENGLWNGARTTVTTTTTLAADKDPSSSSDTVNNLRQPSRGPGSSKTSAWAGSHPDRDVPDAHVNGINVLSETRVDVKHLYPQP